MTISKSGKIGAGATLLASLSLLPLQAQAATPEELEEKLNKAMDLIEAQAQQIDELAQELNNLKNQNFEYSSNPSPKSDNASDDIDRLEVRVQDAEETLYELDDKVGSRAVVNAFDAGSLDIGGFIHTTYTNIESDQGSAQAFDTQNFELLIKAQIDDHWSAFFAGGFLREEGDGKVLDPSGVNPEFRLANKNPQIIGWVNYKHSDLVNVQFGRMITPHGIINPEHFPQILLDPRQPQFLRPFSGDTVFPNFITGAQLHGKKFFGDGENYLQYNSYIATAQSDPEALLYGGRVGFTHGASGATLGVNAMTGQRDDNDSQSDYSMIGADLVIDKGALLWKNEVFQTQEDQAGFDDRLGWYTQPAWRINDQWTAFYRYDYLNDGNNLNGGPATENVVGITVKPEPYVHLRLTGTQKEIESNGTVTQDRDAQIVQASATISF